MVILIAAMLGIVFLDQLTKWLAVIFLSEGNDVILIDRILGLSYVTNRGAAGGMLSDRRWVFMVFSTVAIVAILVYLFRCRPKSKVVRAALSMIVGGGIGNMIDRSFLGYVIDFISMPFLPWFNVDFSLNPFHFSMTRVDFPVYNVADSFVCVGTFLLVGYLVAEIIRSAPDEKKKKSGTPEDGEEPETAEEDADDGTE